MLKKESKALYPEELALHNPSAAAYEVNASQIMVQNPVAGMADESTELPNLTQHVPVENEQVNTDTRLGQNSCSIYMPKSAKHNRLREEQDNKVEDEDEAYHLNDKSRNDGHSRS